MNSLARFARQRPILSYIILTLGWSFFFWGLILTVTPAGTLFAEPMNPNAFIFMMIGLIGPTFASLILTRTIYGKGSIRALYGRLGLWRLGVWWMIAFTPLLLNLAQYAAYALFGANAPVDFGARLPMGIMFGITAGLLEEFGWRGFLLPHLQKHFSPFVSALIVGLVWGGLWHGFADYIGVAQEGTTKIALILLLGPVLLTAYSVIMTALYNGTRGSMFAVVLFHFWISFSGVVLDIPSATDGERVAWASMYCVLIWVVALVVAVRQGMFENAPTLKPRTV